MTSARPGHGARFLAPTAGVRSTEANVPVFDARVLADQDVLETLRLLNRRRFWNVRVMPSLAISCGGRRVMSTP